MGEPVAPLIRALALALWAAVLLRSSVDGRLDLLLRATFHPLVLIAGLGLLAIALLQAVLGWRQRERGEQAGHRRDRRMALITATIAALVLARHPDWKAVDVTKRLIDRGLPICGTSMVRLDAAAVVLDYTPPSRC